MCRSCFNINAAVRARARVHTRRTAADPRECVHVIKGKLTGEVIFVRPACAHQCACARVLCVCPSAAHATCMSVHVSTLDPGEMLMSECVFVGEGGG